MLKIGFLTVLTLNAWILDLPLGVGAKDVAERVALMPEKLASTGADLIALQEVWNNKHRDKLILDMKRNGYRAVHGAGEGYLKFGSGLLIFSKLPLNGEPSEMNFSEFTRMDERFTSKGGLHTAVGREKCIDFFTTHLGAISYDQDAGRYSEVHQDIRLRQARELLTWIDETKKCDTQLLAGDLNANSFDSNATIALFSDWLDTFGILSGFQPAFTFSKENEYMAGGVFSGAPDEAVDYIFVSRKSRLRPIESKIVFQEKVTETIPRLSDHYGILTRFEISE